MVSVSDDVQRTLGRLEGKVDSILQRLESFENKVERKETEQDNRIDGLTKKVYLMSGGLSVITSILTHFLTTWIK